MVRTFAFVLALCAAAAGTAGAADTASSPGTAGAASPFMAYHGEQLYRRFCASCHGPQGYGDGAVAKSLNLVLADLTRIAARHGGKFPEDRVRRIVDGREVVGGHGDRTMPVWGQEFGAGEAGGLAPQEAAVLVDRLVGYVSSIQR